MRCEDALPYALDADVPADVSDHITGCRTCQDAVGEAVLGRDALVDGAGRPEGLEERVVAAVLAEHRQSPAAKRVAAARSRRRVGLLTVAAAALALLAVAAGLFLAGGSSGRHNLAFVGTAAAPPGARGALHIQEDGPTLRMTLSASGLPDADPGQDYELWVSTHDGQRLSAGQFRSLAQAQTLTLDLRWRDWASCGVNRLDGTNSGKGTNVLRVSANAEGTYSN